MLSHDPKPTLYPEYHLISPLPPTELPNLLGRIVAAKASPTDAYYPPDPRLALSQHPAPLTTTDRDFSTLFHASANKSASAAISALLHLDFSSDADRSRYFAANVVRTRTLPQHCDALKALLERYREEILSLLVDNGGVGYLVVGVKSAVDGRSGVRVGEAKRAGVEVDLPVSTAVAAASHGVVSVGTAADVSVGGGAGREVGREVKSEMVGEQVFAVRYRRVVLKKAFLSRKKGKGVVEYGQIERAHFDSGVFDRTEVEEVEEDDEDEEGRGGVEEGFEDDDVRLEEEGGGVVEGEGKTGVLVEEGEKLA